MRLKLNNDLDQWKETLPAPFLPTFQTKPSEYQPCGIISFANDIHGPSDVPHDTTPLHVLTIPLSRLSSILLPRAPPPNQQHPTPHNPATASFRHQRKPTKHPPPSQTNQTHTPNTRLNASPSSAASAPSPNPTQTPRALC